MNDTNIEESAHTKTPLKSNENRPPRDYSQSGFFALQRGLKGVGAGWLADAGELAAPLRAWRAEVKAALGGESISPQREAILDAVLMDVVLLASVDAFIATMPSPVNKSRRALFPIITERSRLADALTKRLQALGLNREQEIALDVRSYLEEHYGGTDDVAAA